jgi:hypothetical protein
VEVTALVVLFLTPAVVPVTSTFTVQVVLGAIGRKLNVRLVSPATGGGDAKLPPHDVLALGGPATCNPAGRLSVKPTPVSVVVELPLVIVNVSVAVGPPIFRPTGIVAAENALLMVAGPITVKLTPLLVVPAPLSVELIGPVILSCTPGVTPVTVTLNEQFVFEASVPPLNEMRLGAVVVTVPPHVAAVPVGTDSPVGSVSVKVIPVSPKLVLGLVSVNVRLVVPPTGIPAAPNPLVIVGGAATVTVAVLLVPPVPPLVDETVPVVLFLTPEVVPVTVTLNVQVPLAATVAPVSTIILLPVIVRVPPH